MLCIARFSTERLFARGGGIGTPGARGSYIAVVLYEVGREAGHGHGAARGRTAEEREMMVRWDSPYP